MAAMETKILPGSYPMNGGDGEVSYARNSQTQRRVLGDAKKIITEAIADLLDIENLTLESSNRFQIADLGCATGPNTLLAVQNIIDAVDHNYKTKHKNPQTLEYQVFFNDRIDNDFNTLFRSLPSARPYFAVGVPGSFYGRLFPEESIHFMHSSSSLNWLSRVCDYVEDVNSPAWNGNSIYCRGEVKEVAEAYSCQYEKDMQIFLDARAEELVAEGLMTLVLCGRENGVPLCQTKLGKTLDFLGSCLFDLANDGTISKEKVESLNLPLYHPTEREIEELINKNGCFCIEKMVTFPISGNHFYDVETWSSMLRSAGFEAILQNQFGSEMVEVFFDRYIKKHADNLFVFNGTEVKNLLQINIVLKRKATEGSSFGQRATH